MKVPNESAEKGEDDKDLLYVIQNIQAEINERFKDLEERVVAIEKKLSN